MRTLALCLVLAVSAGCGGTSQQHTAASTAQAAPGCRALVASLGRLADPTSMTVQRVELSRLTRVTRELRRRFGVEARAAAEEYGASLRAEHESASARGDGRVTASRRLHAQAETRYARGGVAARTVSSRCPEP